MVIYYLGNFLPEASTENHIAKTLRSMGHDVVELQENFIQPEHLAERFRHEKFDLFLFTRTWGQTLWNDHLSILEARSIPSASFHLDLYHGLQRDGNIAGDAFWRTDFVFTPDGDPESAKFFKKRGINHYYLKPGVYEDECILFEVEKSKEIVFVGSYGYHPEYPYRQQLIDWLNQKYPNHFEHWGPEGMGHIRGEELNRLYSTTKIAIGDSLLLPGHTHYTSDRLFEAPGRGAFMITPRIKGLENCFIEDREMVYYKHGDFDELKRKIDYYLGEHDEREAIRKAGHERVKRDHTYTNRMAEMLDVIGSNTSKKVNRDLEDVKATV